VTAEREVAARGGTLVGELLVEVVKQDAEVGMSRELRATTISHRQAARQGLPFTICDDSMSATRLPW
jgi:hypothetical protein